MSIKKDIQTLAYLQQKEQEAKTLEQQQLKELEQLKKDVVNLIDAELIEVLDNNEQDLLYYYFNNKYELIDNIYLKLINIKIKQRKKNTGKVKANGITSFDYEYIEKYKSYNQEHLKEFIEKELYNYIKSITKEQKEEQKATKEKENKKKSVQRFIDILMETKNICGYSDDIFRNKLKSGQDLKIIFDYYGYNLNDAVAITNYKKAKKIYLNNILEPPETQEVKEKRTIAGLSIPTALLGIVLGIFEGAAKKR